MEIWERGMTILNKLKELNKLNKLNKLKELYALIPLLLQNLLNKFIYAGKNKNY